MAGLTQSWLWLARGRGRPFCRLVLRFRPPQGESLWLVLPLLILVQITSL
jgi:hypothetical protein